MDERLTRKSGSVSDFIYIRGIEITQATQWYRADEHLKYLQIQSRSGKILWPSDNTIPLVEGKAALVRVYLRNEWWFSREEVWGCPPGCKDDRTFGDCVPIDRTHPPAGGCEPVIIQQAQKYPSFRGTLEVTRLHTSVVSPFYRLVTTIKTSSRPVQDSGYSDQRGEKQSNTLRFFIPPDQMYGRMLFHVSVILPNDKVVQDELEVDVPLKRTLRVRGIMITYVGPNKKQSGTIILPPPSMQDLQDTIPLPVRMFPVKSVSECTPGGEYTWSGPLITADDWTDLTTELLSHSIADGHDPNVIYYGLLPSSTPIIPLPDRDGYVGGITSPNRVVACGRSGDAIAMAHELGHVCGLDHAPCGDPNDPDPSFPRYHPYPAASIGEFGVDLAGSDANGVAIQEPTSVYDVMSYCYPKWISPHNYVMLQESKKLMQPEPSLGSRYRAVSLIGVAFSEDEVEVKNVARVEAFTRTTGRKQTSLVAELIGENGTVVSRAPVWSLRTGGANLECGCQTTSEQSCPCIFQAFVPEVERGVALRIRREDKELWSRKAPSVPTRITEWRARVTSAAPQKGRGFHVAVEWQASSADKQELVAWVQWSNDEGGTWRALATGLRKRNTEINTAHLPAGNVLLRLVVHDGFDSTTSKTLSLRVPRRDAAITIYAPGESQTLVAGEPLRLWAAATGDDGHCPSPENVEWFLNGKSVSNGLDVFTTAPGGGQHRAAVVVSVRGRKTKREVTFRTVNPSSESRRSDR